MDIQEIQEREAFEAWAKISIENFVDLEHYGKFYVVQENSRLTISKREFLLLAANRGWKAWQERAKLQTVPEGFVLVQKSEIGHYYYDESEGMYIDEPDHFLTDLDVGEAQEVKCRDYFDLPSKYAAKIWDENNQDVGTWGIFDTEAEANNVAAHCKAMIEAQEQSHEK
mgnify:CR=1 FL=1